MGNIGIKISKPGKDVLTAGADDLIFWSKEKTLSVKLRGSTTVTTSPETGEGQTVIEHNFGYVPQFIAYVTPYVSQLESKYVFSYLDYVNLDYGIRLEDVGGTLYETVTGYTTDTDIVFKASLWWSMEGTPSYGEFTYNIDYIIFAEEAVPLT